MDLHNGLDIEVYDLRPTDLHYYCYYWQQWVCTHCRSTTEELKSRWWRKYREKEIV